MAVSRRLRFEVLRRDSHTCRYCGAKAPDVTLTVDHVVPVALGGADEATNLVTSCMPCNSGKASIQPDSSLVADVEADAIRWARARASAIAAWRDKRRALERDLAAFAEAWDVWSVDDGEERILVPREDDYGSTGLCMSCWAWQNDAPRKPA